MMAGNAVLQRRIDLDWLRVIAVLLLVPFHAALIFLPDPALVAYVKDNRPSAILTPLVDFLSRWQLEVLFFVAGAASWYALGKRSVGRYLLERLQRLLVPFIFGLLVLVPLMVNMRFLGQPEAASLGQIYVRFFARGSDLTGMTGGFTPAHLWFLLYLFTFCVAGLPLFLLLRLPSVQRGLARLAGLPGVIGLLYLGCVPLALARQVDLVGLGDKDPLYYFLIVLAGYLFTSQPRFQEAIDRAIWVSLSLALVATLAPQVPAVVALLAAPTAGFASLLLFKLSQWAWLLAILGGAHRWLSSDSPVLRYAGEAAMPFYILHLPLVTLVGLGVVGLSAGVLMKYALVVVLATLATLAVYDLAIKRVGVLRFCFGMRPRVKAGVELALGHV
jgi:glucans biosynthesis protein C